MKTFRADLHIHTLLSPCGDLEMSPKNIIKQAKTKKLDIIGITDHNTTKHCKLVRKLAEQSELMVFAGVEVTTKEEIHCLAFFDNDTSLEEFQRFIEGRLPYFPNDPDRFGYQPVINELEQILEMENTLLILAIEAGIEEVEIIVHMLGGLFIPAHVDRQYYSLISQLGFIPADLKSDAFEITRYTNESDFRKSQPAVGLKPLLKSSDAHYLNNIGQAYTELVMQSPTFDEFRLALQGSDERKTIIK